MPSSDAMETKYLPVIAYHKRYGVRQPALICDAMKMPVLEEIVERASRAISRGRTDYGQHFAVKWGGRWQLYQKGEKPVLIHKRLSKAAAEMWLMYRGHLESV